MNILQLGSEISSLHPNSELNLVHTEGSAQAQLRLASEFSEPSAELSQCEMPTKFWEGSGFLRALLDILIEVFKPSF